MSIIFIPKIAASYSGLIKPIVIPVKPLSPNATHEYNSWSAKELSQLVNLRAIGLSYKKIGKLIHRSGSSCANTLSRNALRDKYKEIQDRMVKEVMSCTTS